MRMALWGAGKFGRAVVSMARTSTVEIVCIIDTNVEKQGTYIGAVPIVSVGTFVKDYQHQIDGIVVSVLAETAYADIVLQLKKLGIKKIGFLKNKGAAGFRDVIWIDKEKPFLAHVEMHIMDSCNLKCKGCTHFSNLYADDERYSWETFSHDLCVLAQKAYVLHLWLLGGEPFLNPDMVAYLRVAREILPETEIKLVSNGLLIPAQSSEVLEAIREYNVTVDISGYPPTLMIKDGIIDCLRRHGISYNFRSPVKQFFALLGRVPINDPYISQENCCDRSCHLLRNGKLYKCPVDGLLYKYKERFHVEEFPKSQGVDLGAADFSLQVSRLEEPIELCKYCVESPRRFDWEVAKNPEKKDWLGVI